MTLSSNKLGGLTDRLHDFRWLKLISLPPMYSIQTTCSSAYQLQDCLSITMPPAIDRMLSPVLWFRQRYSVVWAPILHLCSLIIVRGAETNQGPRVISQLVYNYELDKDRQHESSQKWSQNLSIDLSASCSIGHRPHPSMLADWTWVKLKIMDLIQELDNECKDKDYLI